MLPSVLKSCASLYSGEQTAGVSSAHILANAGYYQSSTLFANLMGKKRRLSVLAFIPPTPGEVQSQRPFVAGLTFP